MRSSAKTETVPFANVVFVAFDRFEPFFAAIVDLWQTATIVGWQKGRLQMFVQRCTITSMEEHLRKEKRKCSQNLNSKETALHLTLEFSLLSMNGLNSVHTILKRNG